MRFLKYLLILCVVLAALLAAAVAINPWLMMAGIGIYEDIKYDIIGKPVYPEDVLNDQYHDSITIENLTAPVAIGAAPLKHWNMSADVTVAATAHYAPQFSMREKHMTSYYPLRQRAVTITSLDKPELPPLRIEDIFTLEDGELWQRPTYTRLERGRYRFTAEFISEPFWTDARGAYCRLPDNTRYLRMKDKLETLRTRPIPDPFPVEVDALVNYKTIAPEMEVSGHHTGPMASHTLAVGPEWNSQMLTLIESTAECALEDIL